MCREFAKPWNLQRARLAYRKGPEGSDIFFYTYFEEVHRVTINQITLYFERVSPSKMIYESIEPSIIAKDNEDIIFEAGIKYDV